MIFFLCLYFLIAFGFMSFCFLSTPKQRERYFNIALPEDNYYDLLNCRDKNNFLDREAIETNYQHLSEEFKEGKIDEEMWVKIRKAYATLINSEKRMEYDHIISSDRISQGFFFIIGGLMWPLTLLSMISVYYDNRLG